MLKFYSNTRVLAMSPVSSLRILVRNSLCRWKRLVNFQMRQEQVLWIGSPSNSGYWFTRLPVSPARNIPEFILLSACDVILISSVLNCRSIHQFPIFFISHALRVNVHNSGKSRESRRVNDKTENGQNKEYALLSYWLSIEEGPGTSYVEAGILKRFKATQKASKLQHSISSQDLICQKINSLIIFDIIDCPYLVSGGDPIIEIGEHPPSGSSIYVLHRV